jgi:hypothetical protein
MIYFKIFLTFKAAYLQFVYACCGRPLLYLFNIQTETVVNINMFNFVHRKLCLQLV